MKKILMVLLVLITIQKINSQHSEYIVEHCVDKSTYQPIEGLICSNDTRTKWIVISPSYLQNTNNPVVNGFSILRFNIGKSNTNDKLIIKFVDNTTITVSVDKSIQSQNTDNTIVCYSVDILDILTLKTKPISIIRYVSGVNGSSFTYHLKESEKTYIANALTNQSVKQVRCIKKN
jgi:hypothetical protein